MLKKVIINLLTGIVIIFSCIGVYTTYKTFKPTQVVTPSTPIIKTESLEELGVLRVAESVKQYTNNVVKGKRLKAIHEMNIFYVASFEYDTKNLVIIENINNLAVSIHIKRSDIYLTEPLVITDKSKVTGNVSILAPNYTDKEQKRDKETAKEVIKQEYLNDEALRRAGERSLKNTLENLCKKLGFKNININFI